MTSTVVNNPSTVVTQPSKMAETVLPNVEEVDSRSNNDHKPLQFRIDDQSDRVSTNPMSNGDKFLNGKHPMSNGDKISTDENTLTNGNRVSTNEKKVSSNSMSNGEKQKLSTNGDVDEIQPQTLTNGELSKSVESRFVSKVSKFHFFLVNFKF
jgi:hypothetical protein